MANIVLTDVVPRNNVVPFRLPSRGVPLPRNNIVPFRRPQNFLSRNISVSKTGTSLAQKALGKLSLALEALGIGSIVGGAVIGYVNPYGEEGENPYSLLREQGNLPFVVSGAELGWEAGSRLRNLWEKLKEIDKQAAQDLVDVPPLQFDFGKVFPELEDISPIKLDLGDLGKELSLLDSPIENLEINKEINKLPDVVVQRTGAEKTVIKKPIENVNEFNWEKFWEKYDDSYKEISVLPEKTEKILKPIAPLPPEVVVTITIPQRVTFEQYKYSPEMDSRLYRLTQRATLYGPAVYTRKPEYINVNVHNFEWPITYRYANVKTIKIIQEKIIYTISEKTDGPTFWYEWHINTRTINSYLIRQKLVIEHGFGVSEILFYIESAGKASEFYYDSSMEYNGYPAKTYQYNYISTLNDKYTITSNGQIIPLTEEQSTPFERENSYMKCKAFDAVKALDSRIKALESKMQVLDTKVGKNALSEIEISVDKLDQFGNPVRDRDGNPVKEKQKIAIDGISGGVSRLLVEGTNLQGINELKEIIGPKVNKIVIPALKEGDRPTELTITGGLGQLATLTTTNAIDINQKLGKSIEGEKINVFNPETGMLEEIAIGGGIGGGIILFTKNFNNFWNKFEKVRKWLMSGRILEILTLAATLHNAHQLSVSIIDTLVQAAQNLIEAIGLKDDEGNTIDLHEMMRKSMEQIMISILGKEAYETAKRKWDRYNRIYQSASNILSAMTSILNALQDTTEIIGSYVGKIGNALKKYHVIADNAYEWMAEKMSAKNRWQRRLNALVEGLEQAENISSNLEQITSNTLEVVQQSQELVKESRELKKLLSENEPDEKNENKVVAEQQKLNAEVSKPPEIKEEDIMFVANKD